jgi:hypothetical protein
LDRSRHVATTHQTTSCSCGGSKHGVRVYEELVPTRGFCRVGSSLPAPKSKIRADVMSVAASVIFATLAFHLDASEYANAVYKAKYDRLWKDELSWSPEDQTQLDRWQSIVRAAETRAPRPPDAPLLANYLSFAFLNEAIATAVEMAGDLAHKDESDDGGGYRHPYIPRLGRAATEPLKKALATGRTMTDGFADDYVRAAREELGSDADSLAFRFIPGRRSACAVHRREVACSWYS